MVNEFVIAGHGDLEKVKKLLAQEPNLINAAWDWGSGDWETALGGASHVGNKTIALYLLEKGARIDLFAAAMLGKLSIVKAAIEAFPENRKITGPHGITLLDHAKVGKEDAVAVVKYLESLKP
ncbi:MAG: ankyrin repeat domain-containing protein [Acidobacteriota bacterium]|nr:ankyrin repeat domain-containing protein [Acidobacteriota bacterium]